ncbi:MAG TPA: acylphosphatase [Gemmatimonadaceae bacterium]|jgi:acylphosphatase|nr:acylphosphatase [Gemmatimonadaceae bacterium]
MLRLRLLVRGAVQGVGFRWFARETAQRLGVAGWVRNCPDGSVEIAVGGDDSRVEQFAAAIARGPHHASVSEVSRDPLGGGEELVKPFEIRR